MLAAVTGGTGFIGSHTVRALVAGGHRVRLLVRDRAKAERVYSRLAAGRELPELVVGDVTDPVAVEQLLAGCDGLVHAAGLVAFEAARAAEVRRNNEESVRLVIGRAVEQGLTRIVHVSSTSALYVPNGAPIRGDAEVQDGLNAYAHSKAVGERFVRGLQDSGAPVLTTYPTAAIGPDDPGFTDPNRAVSFFVRFGAVITSSGYQPVDVRDLASLHVALLESGPPGGRYVAAGPCYPWPDLYARVERVTGRRLPRWRVPGALMRAAGVLGDAAAPLLGSLPIPVTKESMEFATRWPGADGTPAQRDFQLSYRDLDETLADTFRWMLSAGHLEAHHIGRLADVR